MFGIFLSNMTPIILRIMTTILIIKLLKNFPEEVTHNIFYMPELQRSTLYLLVSEEDILLHTYSSSCNLCVYFYYPLGSDARYSVFVKCVRFLKTHRELSIFP